MNQKEQKISLAGLGLVFGTAFGAIIGNMFGNVGLGIALGAAFGLLCAPAIKNRQQKKSVRLP
jgi:uncharacterized membrane protein